MFPLGLYGVGKAAVNPPALVVLSHTPMSATRTIAWCGKGIVYDTGGLCIKAKVLKKKKKKKHQRHQVDGQRTRKTFARFSRSAPKKKTYEG